ncbi:hypothetical protein VPH35_036197 [Triticum aestivum]
MYWVAMSTSWMVLVDGRGSWMLAEVYTWRLIPLPSINIALLWHRGPEYSESYSSQHDTKFDLLKVVICQVPTRSANYKDFRLIAFFNRGIAYLTGHCGKWINLHVHRRIIHPPWFSDSIEHKGFIYTVDSFYAWTYCWPTPVIATNGCYSSRLVSIPFLILEPFKEKRHGSCRWFLARSDDGERLMIVRTYRTCCFAEYNHSHCKVFE